MLNKLDLELFTILDSEIDKTLSNGCILNIGKFVTIGNLDDGIYSYEYNYKGQKKYKILYDYNNVIKKYTILGHYPTTNTVLRYLQKSNLDYLDLRMYIGLTIPGPQIIIQYRLDITKEIKDYSDEQKQELIDFLKNLSTNK